jgi:hypothetical protein
LDHKLWVHWTSPQVRLITWNNLGLCRLVSKMMTLLELPSLSNLNPVDWVAFYGLTYSLYLPYILIPVPQPTTTSSSKAIKTSDCAKKSHLFINPRVFTAPLQPQPAPAFDG